MNHDVKQSGSPSAPAAEPQATVIRGQARFSILTDRMLRLEWSEDGRHEDRATMTVAHRRLAVPSFSVRDLGAGGCVIQTEKLRLTYRGGCFNSRNLSVELSDGTLWKPGQKDRGNLGGTLRSLDGFDGGGRYQTRDGKNVWVREKLPPGLISRSGWSLHDDSRTPVLNETGKEPWPASRPAGAMDWYFLGYGRDFRACLRDAAQIFGRQPLPPRYILGYWYSRYWCYTDTELDRLVDEFDGHGIPLDVLVVDTDWHLLGWTGYTPDPACFPDMPGFLARMRRRGLHLTFNLHPGDGVGDHEAAFAAVKESLPDAGRRIEAEKPSGDGFLRCRTRIPFAPTDPSYISAYFEQVHRPLERQGVDFWWMDWHEGESAEIPGLDLTAWINRLHYLDQQRNPERRGQRALIFSRFGRLGSGRHPIGFSGDTGISWRMLAYQPEFTATAGNVLFGYWSHDIGGHMGEQRPDGELYVRWMQYGALSPVLRTHASKRPSFDRRFWSYPEPFSRLLAQTVQWRYRMAPTLYQACHAAFASGLSPCRPLYVHHPDTDEAYRHQDQYYFGEHLLCAPVLSPGDPKTLLARRPLWLPAGSWLDTARGVAMEGGAHAPLYALGEIPVFVRPGSVLWEQRPVRRLTPGSYPHPVLVCHPGGDGEGDLYEDDGVSEDYRDGGSSILTARQRRLPGRCTIEVAAVRGRFSGQIHRRPLDLWLPGVLPPSRVLVGDRNLPFDPAGGPDSWSWDGERAGLAVRLAEHDQRRPMTVTIEGLRETPPGLPALLTRLGQLMEWTKDNSPVRTLHREERLPIWLAQTGRRIAMRPQTAEEELSALRDGLGRLGDILRFHAVTLPKGVTATDPEWVRVRIDWGRAWARAERLRAAMQATFPEWFM